MQNQISFGIHPHKRKTVGPTQYSTSLYSTIALDIINSDSLLCYFEIHHFTWHVTYIPACKFYTGLQFSNLTCSYKKCLTYCTESAEIIPIMLQIYVFQNKTLWGIQIWVQNNQWLSLPSTKKLCWHQKSLVLACLNAFFKILKF